jgi:4-hydroxysphinganine ceramide fatty acyl 2-hydroxylase
MFLVFLRHGSVAALVAGVAILGLAFLSGWIESRLALILLGALLFYLSE